MKVKIHQGRNVKRFREMRGIKQEALADELGQDWNQKKVSLLEQKEDIDPEIISKVSEILKIPEEAIKTFNDDIAMLALTNTKELSPARNNLNPIEEILCLHKEIIDLYEHQIIERKEMIRLLEEML